MDCEKYFNIVLFIELFSRRVAFFIKIKIKFICFTCSGVFPATAAKSNFTVAGLGLIPTEDKVALMLASSE